MTTYLGLGSFIESFNPYAEDTTPPDPTVADSGIIIATHNQPPPDPTALFPTLSNFPYLYWPFRQPEESRDYPAWDRGVEKYPVTWPGGKVGRTNKLLEVEMCEIVKAMVIPYTYKRVIGRVLTNPTTIDMKAHLVVGYTSPGDITPNETQSGARDPARSQRYEAIGTLIEEEHPVKRGEMGFAQHDTILVADLNVPTPPFVQNAICWLEHKSLQSFNDPPPPVIKYPFGSSADDEMEMCDKQQCLTWAFPQPERPSDTAYGPGWWMRGYQVTKGFRVRYQVVDPNPPPGSKPQGGWILIGYSGSGDY